PSNAGLTDLHVLSLAVNRNAPDTIYAGTARGVFKSEDGGAHWAPTALTTYRIHALVTDPLDAGIVYAVAAGLGVLTTMNGGSTWQLSNAELPYAYSRVAE